MISLLPAAAALFVKVVSLHDALSDHLVSLHDFAFGCRCRLVCEACLPSLAAAAALSPKLVSLHGFALGCRCRLVSQACLPS